MLSALSPYHRPSVTTSRVLSRRSRKTIPPQVVVLVLDNPGDELHEFPHFAHMVGARCGWASLIRVLRKRRMPMPRLPSRLGSMPAASLFSRRKPYLGLGKLPCIESQTAHHNVP